MNKSILPLLLTSLLPLVVSADQLTVEADLVVEGDTILEQALTVQGNNGVLFKGTYGQGSIPAEGAGTRMMWYPAKGAFRAGRVIGNRWDDSNVGNYSTAFGSRTQASGYSSMAWGSSTTASGYSSTAWGEDTTATEFVSTASGYWAWATGFASTAWGEDTGAAGNCSTAWGHWAIATESYSTAWGYYTTASGYISTAMGDFTKAESNSSLAIGRNNIGGGHPTQWNDTDPLFEIGNGDHPWQSNPIPSNALTVLKNGRTTLENKFWEDQDPTAVPTDPDASDGEALVVNGHARFAGRVVMEPQGDIPMFGQ
jgi:hypothetical protein